MSLLLVMFLVSVVLVLVVGIYSLLVTRNLMRILISVEILSKAVTLLMIAAGYVTGKAAQAQTYVITIIVIEAVLLVISAGIVLGIYRKHKSLDTRNINNLKG